MLLALVIIALLVGSPLLHGRASVPMFRGAATRTSVMPGPGPRVPIQAALYQLTTGAVPFTTSPVIGGGLVFVVDDSGWVTALAEEDLGYRWSVDLGAPVRSSPVLVGDRLVVGSDRGDVVALDVADGAQDWIFPTGEPGLGSLRLRRWHPVRAQRGRHAVRPEHGAARSGGGRDTLARH